MLSAPWLATARRISPWTRRVVLLLSRVVPDVPLSRPRSNPGVLTADPDMQEAYRHDPLIHHTLTPRFFHEVEKAQVGALGGALDPSIPVLVLAPLEDGMVDTGVTLRWAGSLDRRAVSVERLPSTHHEPHNDVSREAVIELVGGWLLERAVG